MQGPDRGVLVTAPKGHGDRRQWAEAIGLGFEIVTAMAIGTGGGWWLEQHVTHWSPWTTVVGFFFGLGAAIRLTMTASKRL